MTTNNQQQSDIPEHLKNANNDTFRLACKDGKLEDVKIMLTMKNINFAYNSNDPLLLASKNGHIEIVKLLLEESKKPESQIHSSDLFNDVIILASRKRHIEIMKLLIADPKFDPYYDGFNLLIWSIKNNHKELTVMLLDHPKVIAKSMK